MSRRGFLAGALGLGGVGGLAALSGCGSAVVAGVAGTSTNPDGVTYWNLFSGGDGANMVTMEDAFRKAKPKVPLEATTLSWGNPYYTKLALATAGGQAPDVAIAHLSRLPLLAQSGILTDLSTVPIAQAGITGDKFTPAAWKKAQLDGRQYAIPLDTHPFVLFYNKKLAAQAGLLGSDGKLVDISGQDRFVEALTKMKAASKGYGAVTSIIADPSTNWRYFDTLYSQLGGQVVTDDGSRVALDGDKAEATLAFMRSLTTEKKLIPGVLDGNGVTSMFSSGKSGFLLDGVWQIPTYADTKLDFDVVPIPAIIGQTQTAYADSHALIIPKDPNRPAERTQQAVAFIKSLLDNSLTWAKGGHVPAWQPVQQSEAFKKLQPQSNYVQAAYDAVYDPPGWYTGAGSDFQTLVGSAVQGVQSGGSPKTGVAQMRRGLTTYAGTRSPAA